ncbi:hypothetical protein E1N52_26695 [Paraburkholderia guartelaensis]|uniref:Uncharacterized protein n=1 Tax=Paraburkholderia guartelaensis TaxID=2546446 RepID=A0A4R5LAB1_9BURK|nr:hypothetical protein [Paraburkholderia guartelaensis]TDG05030.1 hypothetical protein E1N52_26695 [Paraburkholderia guartelaensis]
MSRPSAISLIVRSRKILLADADERPPGEAERLRAAADDLTRLLFDVRAGRVNAFELSEPTRMRVVVSAD